MASQRDQAVSGLADRLVSLLNEDLRLCQQLLACIRRESALLLDHAHDTFMQESALKESVLLELREAEAVRARLLQQFGHADISCAIAACPADATTLAALQASLKTASQTCHTENRQLGKLIHGQSRFFNFLLGNLLPGHRENLTYHSNGSRPSGSGVGKLVSV